MADTNFERMKSMLGERYPVWLAAHERSVKRKIDRCLKGTNEERKKVPSLKKTLKVVEKEMKTVSKSLKAVASMA